MNLKRFSIRFNLDDGSISKEVIRIINRSYELSDLESLIRKVVSDEFEKRKLNPSSFEVESNPEDENTILDFLDSF